MTYVVHLSICSANNLQVYAVVLRIFRRVLRSMYSPRKKYATQPHERTHTNEKKEPLHYIFKFDSKRVLFFVALIIFPIPLFSAVAGRNEVSASTKWKCSKLT